MAHLRKLLNRLVGLVFLVVTLTVVVCFYRALFLFPEPKVDMKCEDSDRHQAIKRSDALIERFQNLLRIKTITRDVKTYDVQPLIDIRQYIEKSFPLIHSNPKIKKEIIAGYSLLYKIEGSNKSLKPYLLCSHLDVVPVDEDKWIVDAFSATIKDEYIYARGSIDVKPTLMSILESVEYLISKNFDFKRTLYLAFGHDEEGNGVEGAAQMAKILKSRGVTFEYVLDEGSTIISNVLPGLFVDNVALISVTEKGYVTVRLEVEDTPGHSSIPPAETSIVILAKALSKFHSKTHVNKFGTGIETGFVNSVAQYAKFPEKLIYANMWLFGPLITTFVENPLINAFARTSTAVTLVSGGTKENITPSLATARINHRIHPSQTVDEIFQYDKNLINDERVHIFYNNSREPHFISDYGEGVFGYEVIEKSVLEVFDKTAAAPSVMVAATDTRYYLPLSRQVYRMTPVLLASKDELKGMHGHNERIKIDSYIKCINFFHHLIINSNDEKIKRPTPKRDEL